MTVTEVRCRDETRVEAAKVEVAQVYRYFEAFRGAFFGPIPSFMLLASMKPLGRGHPRWPPRFGLFCVAVAGATNFALAMRVHEDADVESDLGNAIQYDYTEEGTAFSEVKFNLTPTHEHDVFAVLSSGRRAGADSDRRIGGTVTTTSTGAHIIAASMTRTTTPDISITLPLTTDITTTSTEIKTSAEMKTTVSVQHTPVLVDADDCDCSISKDWLDVPDTVERISDVVSYSLKSLLMFVFGGLTTEQQKARIMLLDKDGSNTVSENELPLLTAFRGSDLRNLLKHLNVHSFEAGLGTRISVAALAAAAEVHKVEKLNSAEGLVECQCLDGQMGFKSLPITVSHDEFRGGLVSSKLLKNITTQLASRILARFRDMVAMDLDGDGETDMWISPLLLPSETKKKSALADGIPQMPQSLPKASDVLKNGRPVTKTTGRKRLKRTVKQRSPSKAVHTTKRTKATKIKHTRSKTKGPSTNISAKSETRRRRFSKASAKSETRRRRFSKASERSRAVDFRTHSTTSTNAMNLTANYASSSNSSNNAYTNLHQSEGESLAHSTKRRIIRALVSSKKRKKKKKKALKEETGVATQETEKSIGSSSEISKNDEKHLLLEQGKSGTNALTDSTADAILFRQAEELVKQADHQKDDDVLVSDLLKKEAEIAIRYANREAASIRAEAIKRLRDAIGLDESEADKVHVRRAKTATIPFS
eukprot:TRINITY_DN3762_c0_g1_i2.p1 TRINITY_DN3762_c0_g1~~TRINITY_DN3762_c0_g1_i2.p1  ORF type:complete len:706 (-),score=101.69 TRINITY_DN3762_c0_g1_i2:218-2335(-)